MKNISWLFFYKNLTIIIKIPKENTNLYFFKEPKKKEIFKENGLRLPSLKLKTKPSQFYKVNKKGNLKEVFKKVKIKNQT